MKAKAGARHAGQGRAATPPLGRWLRHGADVVRIEHWPVWTHAAFDPVDEADVDPETHPPLTRIACDGEGQHWVVPEVDALAEATIVESGTDTWPDEANENGLWVEVNDHGNASAWVAVAVTRMARGERATRDPGLERLAPRWADRLRIAQPGHPCPAQGARTHWRDWSGFERKIAAMRRLCARLGCAQVNDAALAREDLEAAGGAREARAQVADGWWDEYEQRIRKAVHPQAGMAVEGDWLVLTVRAAHGGALAERTPGGDGPEETIWIETIGGETTRIERVAAATLAWEAV